MQMPFPHNIKEIVLLMRPQLAWPLQGSASEFSRNESSYD